MSVKVKSSSITDPGLNPHKKVNEDSYLILEKEGVYIIADGVGGAHAGDVASQSAVNAIKRSVSDSREFSKRLQSDSIRLMKDLIIAGNEAVYDIAKKKGVQMATTIAMMMLTEEETAILGHVGDSRIYLARDGKLIHLTKDHSKLQALLDSGSIGPGEADDYEERHIITKALGLQAEIDPDIQKVMIKHKDIFVICTDGIYNHNSDDEILDNVVSNQNDLKRVCRVFKDYCYKRGAKDHLTAIVLKIEEKDDDKIDTKRLKMTPDMMDTIIKK